MHSCGKQVVADRFCMDQHHDRQKDFASPRSESLTRSRPRSRGGISSQVLPPTGHESPASPSRRKEYLSGPPGANLEPLRRSNSNAELSYRRGLNSVRRHRDASEPSSPTSANSNASGSSSIPKGHQEFDFMDTLSTSASSPSLRSGNPTDSPTATMTLLRAMKRPDDRLNRRRKSQTMDENSGKLQELQEYTESPKTPSSPFLLPITGKARSPLFDFATESEEVSPKSPGQPRGKVRNTLREYTAASECADKSPKYRPPSAGLPKQPLQRVRSEPRGITDRPSLCGDLQPESTDRRQSEPSMGLSSEEKASLSSLPPCTPSGLLARRRGDRPNLQSLGLSIEKRAIAPQKQIKHLAEGQKIFDLYFWDEVIQEDGCGGKVVVCAPKVVTELTPRSPFAAKGNEGETCVGTYVMKMKAKDQLRKHASEEQFRNAQLKMLNLPPHSGILPLKDVLECEKNYYVVMERANGGSLLCSLLDEFPDGVMPERAVRRVIKEILSAISHLHSEGILHRDIKIDNLVVEINDEPLSPGTNVTNCRTVKLIDFDIVDPEWLPNSPGKQVREWAGTLQNAAPETFAGYYSQQSDLYSVGTILYLLMTGRSPYDDDLFSDYRDFQNLSGLVADLAAVEIDWDAQCWHDHPLCRDFCKKLLAFDPRDRPATAEDAAKHDWFKQSKQRCSPV